MIEPMSIEQQAIPTTKRIGAGPHSKLLFILLYGSLLGLGSVFIGAPSHNLWSVRYLWQQAGHPLAALLPAAGDAVPADHRSGHLWQARALLAAGQSLPAEALLQPVLAQGDYDAQRLQAEILAARGDLTGAIHQWAQVGAVDDLLLAARQAGQQGQVEVAMLAYRTAYGLAPERTVLPFAGFLRRERQDFAAAETLLRDYIAAMPSSRYLVSWLRELGALYREQEAWDKAISILEPLVNAIPDSIGDRINLGWAYYERGDSIETVMAQFQYAIRVNPQIGEGYFAVANLLAKTGSLQEADVWYKQAIERNPEKHWWWLSQADVALQNGNLSFAVTLYQQIEQRFPDFAEGHYRAAQAYRQNNQAQLAVQAIEKAVTLVTAQESRQYATIAAYYQRASQIYEWAGEFSKAAVANQEAKRFAGFLSTAK